MGLLAFAFELYFAMVLGISGLAKVNDPQHFETVLHQQKIMPEWSIRLTSRIVPWVEIVLALLLLSGIAIEATAIIATFLFILFLGLKFFLLKTKRTEDCGCYGNTNSQQIDGPSIVVSSILAWLAIIHLWLVAHVVPLSWQWRLISSILIVSIGWLLLRKFAKGQHLVSLAHPLQSQLGGIELGISAPTFIATDQQGNMVNLADFQGKQCLLLFVSPGCFACPKALEAMNAILQSRQDLIGVVVGGPDHERNHLYATEQSVVVPLLTPEPDVVEKLYHISAFPFMFLLDEANVIRAKGVVNNVEHIHELLSNAYASASVRN